MRRDILNSNMSKPYQNTATSENEKIVAYAIKRRDMNARIIKNIHVYTTTEFFLLLSVFKRV